MTLLYVLDIPYAQPGRLNLSELEDLGEVS